MTGYIYKYTNKENGKIYIGQTTNIEVRRKSHKNCKHKDPFHSAIKYYGMDNFDFTILIMIEEEDIKLLKDKLNYWENYYIVSENSKYPIGYNLTDGGEGCPGRILTEEHKRKISESHKGKKLSEETKQKLRGLKRTQKQCENISKSLKGRNVWNKGLKTPQCIIDKQIESRKWFYDSGGPNIGKKLSEEHKRKISESHKGKKLSEETKQKLREFNLTHPEIYNNRRGRPMCEDQKNKISKSLKGKTNTKGKIWVYKDGKTTLINKEDIQNYLNNGWIKGRKCKK